jgi:catechol 2,3-dioxygenase-like lactoylglutathione lyase family enzyme
VRFYIALLGMKLETFSQGRKAFRFGNQKIELHIKGKEFEPKAHTPMPGALDLGLIADRPLDDVIAHLRGRGAQIIEGPVPRTGATGPIRSIYLRDPDLNLTEIAEPVS